ncbi:MAG TPA: glycosyltransferase, partial [Firmicutes bacterium]|nr:glycosyltransferase [Bacillota bacterium]
YVGRFVKEKGVFLFLKKFNQTEVRISLVGSGYFKKQIKMLVEQRFGNAQMFDWIYDKQELAELYLRSKVIIIPSIYPEPFGLVGLESMIFKKPVVAFNVGGIGEWLKDGVNGFIVKEGDWREFNRKVILLLSDEELMRKMGENANLLYRKNFTFDKHFERLKDIFKNISKAQDKSEEPSG